MTIVRIVDVETCGLPPDNAQVCEVATVDLVLADANVWTRGRMWSSLVNPGRPIPPEASAIHHIVDDMVKDAPTLDQLAETIWAPDGDHGLPDFFAAHEARFEKECLKAVGDSKWICTRKAPMTAWPDAPNHKNQTLRYWLGLKLANAALAEPHRALGDAYVTAAILRRLLIGAGLVVDDLVTISANPVLLPRLTFGEHAMKPMAEVPLSYLDWIVNKSRGPWDEDILYTARKYLDAGRDAQRQRSPV